MNFIIIGAGDVGRSLGAQLAAHQHNVTLIDKDPDTLHSELSELDLKVVVGNGCSPEVLNQAGIEEADYVIAVTHSDEANIAACFVSRLVNPKPKRIARIRDLDLAERFVSPELLNEYFDLVVNPEEAGADYLLKLFQLPGAKEFVDLGYGKVRVLGLGITDECPVLNQSLSTIHSQYETTPLSIVAIVRAGRIFCPSAAELLKVGDIAYMVTSPEASKQAFELSGRALREGQTAMMWGGSFLSRSLALRLDQEGVRLKLILTDERKQLEMADQLRHALVLSGEGTDQALLMEEHVYDMDAFIAASDDEENNVLAALLAKKLGAKHAVAVVSKRSYLPLVSAVGVDVVVSARLAASSAIFRHIHSRSLLTEIAPHCEGGGFLELDISSEMPLSGKLLRDLALPQGVRVGAILREGNVCAPTPMEALLEGDRVIFFSLKSSTKKLGKLLNLPVNSL